MFLTQTKIVMNLEICKNNKTVLLYSPFAIPTLHLCASYGVF